MMRVMIVDDEPLAREELAALLGELGACEIVASCGNAIEAIKAINRHRPEVLFLDIRMPVIDGFELLGMISQEVMPHVVFVTAYDQHALKAFEEKTADYLLKPIDKERLVKTFAKLKGLLHSGLSPHYEVTPLNRIPCVNGNRVRLIDPAEIDYVRSDLSGVHIVLPGGEGHSELTLKVLEERTGLVRCHRQYLVNLNRLEEIQLFDNGLAEIRTRSGALLPVSRRFLKILKTHLGI